jgi:hypothetical protein
VFLARKFGTVWFAEWGHAVAQLFDALRYKPDGVIGIFR